MVGEWVQVRLDSVATLRNGAGIKQEFFSESGIPLARVSDFTQDSIDLSDCKNVEPIHAEGWKSHLLREGNVVVATVGSWPPNWTSVVGKVVRVPAGASGALQNQNTCCVLPSPNLLDQEFLFYRLKLEDFAWHAANSAGGSANQARLPVKKLGEFEFFLPPLVDQKEIASILSALDNKISLNRQINTTLESMAQVLFKSWFVDFDPVIDNALAAGNEIPDALQKRAARREALRQKTNQTTAATDAVSSEQALPETGLSAQRLPPEIQQLFPDRFVLTEEMGWVPEGWEAVRFSQLVDAKQGKYLAKTEMVESQDDVFQYPVWGGNGILGYSQKKSYDVPITLMTCRGSNCGLIKTTQSSSWISNNSFACKSRYGSEYFLYLYFISEDFSDCVSGSAQPQITYTALKNKLMKYPISTEICNVFSELVAVYREKQFLNDRQNELLTNLRDSLLPKLLSGQITIPDAEQQLAEVL